jgi:hypothetical protein
LEFFQNLPYWVHLYARGDSQSHRKSPNREGFNRILPRAIAMHNPHLKAVTISKGIELQGKRDSESLFQNQSFAATQNLLRLFIQELQAFEIKMYKIKWFQKQ